MALYYADYYTHAPDAPPPRSRLYHLYEEIASLYLHHVHGYPEERATAVSRVLWPLIRLLPVRVSAIEERVLSLGARPNGRLLEIGCGSGVALARLVALGWQGVGLDFDAGAVALAAARGLDVRAGAIEAQRFPDGSFDAVACAHVLEHLPDPLRTLTEACRVLKPGGVFVAYTPNIASPGHAIFRKYWRGLEPPRHLVLFTPRPLAELARRGGFPHPEVRSSFRGAGRILLASWALARGRAMPPTGTAAGIVAEVLSFCEWMLDRVGLSRAEELILVATKPVTATVTP
jgi:SAM-dependent methyltransferase